MGMLSWDHRVFALGGGVVIDYEVRIEGPGGSAVFNAQPDADIVNAWVAASAPIDVGSWSVQSGTWGAILADVTSLRISIEVVDNSATIGEITGMDNVVLANPTGVPLLGPGGIWLLGGMLAGLGGAMIARGARRPA